MNVVIIGWYGTETLGDRAILAGLLEVIYKTTPVDEVQLGSLFPFFTQRTLAEDHSFWSELSGADLNISVFDSTNPKALKKAIDRGDVLLMGGGPLMHISELHMVEFAFRYAKSRGKQTGLMGCGVGPIYSKAFHKPLLRIIDQSDVAVLRDDASRVELEHIAAARKWSLDTDLELALDPAVLPCHHYRSAHTKTDSLAKDNQISVNLRDFPSEYAEGKSVRAEANTRSINFVRSLAEENPESDILLVPMHYFHVGNDDRYFLNRVKREARCENIQVQQAPLNLQETLRIFSRSRYCVGMRFHSVVFQTLVSGKNLVLDYTQPGKGKISGFLQEINGWDFYKPRYANLQLGNLSIHSLPTFEKSFELHDSKIEDTRKTYADAFRKLL